MGRFTITRRRFSVAAASAALSLRAQTTSPNLAHIDVAKLDGSIILVNAKDALEAPLASVTVTTQPQLQRACGTVATLTAAFLVSHDEMYALRAGKHLGALFAASPTRLNPQFTIADPTPSAPAPAAGVLTIADIAPLAEVARALAFLGDTAAIGTELEAAHTWFAEFLDWLTSARHPVLARDTQDHNASAWLLLASAVSRAQHNDKLLEDCRHRFRKPTLRNQIDLNGIFPHEVASETPFRNSLLNFDLLAGCAQLLSTPFDDEWGFQLDDGTGMRSVAAYLYPSLQERHNWKFLADPQFFRDLPGRRPALLFAGRAYSRPEYVATWQATPPLNFNTLPAPVAASFPIREPLLFTARAPHGL